MNVWDEWREGGGEGREGGGREGGRYRCRKEIEVNPWLWLACNFHDIISCFSQFTNICENEDKKIHILNRPLSRLTEFSLINL